MVELSGLSDLARIVDPVARRFVDEGHRLYLVGGVVRDLVLAGDGPFDVSANDIDLTTDALPDEIKRIVAPLADALWAQGERFGTIGAQIGGAPLEITTHRAEAYDPDSRKPIVTFGHDLHEDLSRRDFTVNAMAIEVPSGAVHDPFGGMTDLADHTLRTPLSPEISFTDDPLRILRAARFVARFELSPAPELVSAAMALSDRLEIVSVERVADEVERLLAVADPAAGLRFLADIGALGHIVHGYQATSSGAERLPLATCLAAAGTGDRPDWGDNTGREALVAVRRAGLLWPLGDEAGRVLSRLRYSRADQRRTVGLIDGARRALSPNFDKAGVRRIAAAVGSADVDLVLALVANIIDCDPDRPVGGRDSDRATELRALVAEVRQNEDLDDLRPSLSGADIMETLGLEPGPDIGRAQRFLAEHRLEHGPLAPEASRRLLIDWWQIEHQAGESDSNPPE